MDFGIQKIFGKCSIFYAVGILDSLTLLIDRDYDCVLIQIDNLKGVQIIQEKTTNGFDSSLVRKINQLLRHFDYWHIRHIFREKIKMWIDWSN